MYETTNQVHVKMRESSKLNAATSDECCDVVSGAKTAHVECRFLEKRCKFMRSADR